MIISHYFTILAFHLMLQPAFNSIVQSSRPASYPDYCTIVLSSSVAVSSGVHQVYRYLLNTKQSASSNSCFFRWLVGLHPTFNLQTLVDKFFPTHVLCLQFVYSTMKMPAKMPPPATCALIIFAGIYTDVALATDFCAYQKKFSQAGIQATYLSRTDIITIVNIYKTLKFGREDLNRTREEVFTRHEAYGPESQFYE